MQTGWFANTEENQENNEKDDKQLEVEKLIADVKSQCEIEAKSLQLKQQNEFKIEEVSFSKLLSLTNRRTKCKLWFGWVFAALTGMLVPSFFWLYGDIFDAFTAVGSEPDEKLKKILDLFMITIGLCVMLVVTGMVYHSCSAQASAKVSADLQSAYLASILR